MPNVQQHHHAEGDGFACDLQAIWTQLQQLRLPLEAATRAATAGTSPSSMHILLDQLQHALPLLPTLNGWLIGYPVTYMVGLLLSPLPMSQPLLMACGAGVMTDV